MRTGNNNQEPTNPSPFKTRLTIRFLQAMKNLNKNTPPPQSMMADKRKRYHNIKVAAYSSLAFSVGPKRAWARALLSKIRNRSLRRYLRNRSRTNVSGACTKRRNPKKGRFGIRQEDGLRRLVPGGEGMEFCRLLKETAHYMMCLKAQVQVMETIVDRCLIQD